MSTEDTQQYYHAADAAQDDQELEAAISFDMPSSESERYSPLARPPTLLSAPMADRILLKRIIFRILAARQSAERVWAVLTLWRDQRPSFLLVYFCRCSGCPLTC